MHLKVLPQRLGDGRGERAVIAFEWLLSCVGADVDVEVTLLAGAVRAEVTLEGLRPGVYGGMLDQVVLPHRGVVADFALEDSGVVGVLHHVDFQDLLAGTTVRTPLALERPLLAVGPQVALEVHLLQGGIVAEVALVGFETFVHAHVYHHQSPPDGGEPADSADVGTVSVVDQGVAHDAAVVRGGKRAHITFVHVVDRVLVERAGFVVVMFALFLCVVFVVVVIFDANLYPFGHLQSRVLQSQRHIIHCDAIQVVHAIFGFTRRTLCVNVRSLAGRIRREPFTMRWFDLQDVSSFAAFSPSLLFLWHLSPGKEEEGN